MIDIKGQLHAMSVEPQYFFSPSVYPFSQIRIQVQSQDQILFMKSKAFEIQLPTSCTVSESSFRPHENGDWCLSCRKTVVDFTEMSDAEVIRYFQNKPAGDSNCGRWRKDQLNKLYQPTPVHQTSTGWWPFFLGSVLSVMSAGKSSGQAPDSSTWKPVTTASRTLTEDSPSSASETPASIVKDTNGQDTIKRGFRKITVQLRVKGIITANSCKPRMGYCRETQEKFTADEKGYFSLVVPNSAKETTYTILIHTRNHISDAVYYLRIVPGKSAYRLKVAKERRFRQGTSGTYAIITKEKQSIWQRILRPFISQNHIEQTSV